jgi:hypothetical protein
VGVGTPATDWPGCRCRHSPDGGVCQFSLPYGPAVEGREAT